MAAESTVQWTTTHRERTRIRVYPEQATSWPHVVVHVPMTGGDLNLTLPATAAHRLGTQILYVAHELPAELPQRLDGHGLCPCCKASA